MGVKETIEAAITRDRAKQLLVELVRVPSPQTELFEAEPLLRKFIETAVEPRLRAMGIEDIRHDAMGNLIAGFGADKTGKSLMLIGNAMNQLPTLTRYPAAVRPAAMRCAAAPIGPRRTTIATTAGNAGRIQPDKTTPSVKSA